MLRSRVQPVDADEESERKWRQDLAAAIGDALLELRVELGQARMNVDGLNHLKANDIVFFKKFPRARALINDIPAFDAVVGTMGPNVAVQIEKLVELDSN